MRGWKSLLGVTRFFLFYFGLISKDDSVLEKDERSEFHKEGDGVCCSKCGQKMTHYPGAKMTHLNYHDGVTFGHLLPKAVGGKNIGKNWVQHECNLCNRAHGNLFRELIRKYGKCPLDVPFPILLKFVIYSIGEFNNSIIGFWFKDYEDRFQQHREALILEKMNGGKKAKFKQKRIESARMLIDASRKRVLEGAT